MAEILSGGSRHYAGRGPTEVNVQIEGSVITVKLVGMLSSVERRLIDFGRIDLVHQIRQVFVEATGEKLCERLRRELGLKVARVTRGTSDYENDIGVLEFHLVE